MQHHIIQHHHIFLIFYYIVLFYLKLKLFFHPRKMKLYLYMQYLLHHLLFHKFLLIIFLCRLKFQQNNSQMIEMIFFDILIINHLDNYNEILYIYNIWIKLYRRNFIFKFNIFISFISKNYYQCNNKSNYNFTKIEIIAIIIIIFFLLQVFFVSSGWRISPISSFIKNWSDIN